MKRIKLTGWRGGAGRRACCWWLSAGSKTHGSRNSCWFRWRRSGTYAEHPEWCTHGSSARSPCASTYPSPTSAILKRTKKNHSIDYYFYSNHRFMRSGNVRAFCCHLFRGWGWRLTLSWVGHVGSSSCLKRPEVNIQPRPGIVSTR